ncbi:hypothetical protein EfmAA96_15630 [Enterococcus faecium]|nr:hypothetical protein EfmAA96_15630 [Enterococcus faecium]
MKNLLISMKGRLNLALNLKEHHHKVQGLDISSTAVSQARENDIPAYQEISEFLATFEQKKIYLFFQKTR